MKTSDVKEFWDRQPRGARIGSIVGAVGLFAVVAVGVYLGIQAATIARHPRASGAPSSGHDASSVSQQVGASPSPTPTPTAALPSATLSPSPAAGGSSGGGPSGGGGSGGGAPARVPDPPLNVTLSVVQHLGSDLTVTVTWGTPKDNGKPITGYKIVVNSGTDFSKSGPVSTSGQVYTVPCGSGGCANREFDAAVLAVNAIGDGPQAFAAFRGGLPAANESCVTGYIAGFIPGLSCTLSDTGDTSIRWTLNGVAQTAYDDKTQPQMQCDASATLKLVLSVSNQAGTTTRTDTFTCPPPFG
jgi:hypothetical protein